VASCVRMNPNPPAFGDACSASVGGAFWGRDHHPPP
jgi:hypothetical protein